MPLIFLCVQLTWWCGFFVHPVNRDCHSGSGVASSPPRPPDPSSSSIRIVGRPRQEGAGSVPACLNPLTRLKLEMSPLFFIDLSWKWLSRDARNVNTKQLETGTSNSKTNGYSAKLDMWVPISVKKRVEGAFSLIQAVDNFSAIMPKDSAVEV